MEKAVLLCVNQMNDANAHW